MNKSFWASSNGMASIVMIGFVSYFLLMEHREHVFQALPYLIILLCPLMHIFMHSGHGGSHHHEDEGEAYRRGLEDGLKKSRGEGHGNKRS